MEPGAGRVRVPDQQRRGVGCEVGGHLAGQVEVRSRSRCRRRRPRSAAPPGRGARAASSSRGSPGSGGEAERVRPLPGPSDFSRPCARRPPQHAHARVAGVAVLGVADREQRSRPRRAPPTPASSAVAVDDRGGPSARRPRSAVPSSVEGPTGDGRRPTSRPGGVAGLDAGAARGGSGAPPANGSVDPAPELVAVGVGEPPDRRAVGGEGGGIGAAGPVGDLAVQVGGAVPDVDLGGAAGVGGVEAAVRGVAGPAGPRHPGRGEPGAPAVLASSSKRRSGTGATGWAGTPRSCRTMSNGRPGRPRLRTPPVRVAPAGWCRGRRLVSGPPVHRAPHRSTSHPTGGVRSGPKGCAVARGRSFPP